MRRLVLVSILAASAALLGACQNEVKAPDNKPAATATPASSATPAASPAISPAASPAKAGASPEVKKDDKAGNSNVKPAETPKAK